MNLTYFIDYQCKIILRAIATFKEAYKETLEGLESFDRWLWESGLVRKLTDKQRVVFQVAKANSPHFFTTSEVQENLGCSYNTAAKVLNGLVELNLFGKEKVGREWLFSMLSRDKIQANWPD